MTPIYNHILKQIQTGDITRAQQTIEQLLQDKPDDAWLHYLQGNVYRRQGLYHNAYNCYLRASEIDPDNPAAEAAYILDEIYSFRNKDLYNQ